MNHSQINGRWGLINKNTNNVRRTTATRAAARNAKRATERIFDFINGVFVR